MSNTKFKILSIDGGGVRGVIPAKILMELEDELQRKHGEDARLYQYFDLICGTSTGGIIALGIALGVSIHKIFDLYNSQASHIFPKRLKLLNLLKTGVFYSRENLETYLIRTYCGEGNSKDSIRLKDCKTRVCVPALEMGTGQLHIYKTPHVSGLIRDLHIPVVDVALMTSAAPVYFKPYSFTHNKIGTDITESYTNMLDGGMAANNPALIGLLEALGIGINLADIELLSLGTGVMPFRNFQKSRYGLCYWTSILNNNSSLRLYEAMSSAQSLYIENSIEILRTGVAKCQLGQFRYVRLQMELSNNINLDSSDKKSLGELVAIGQSLYTNNSTDLLPFIENKVKLYNK